MKVPPQMVKSLAALFVAAVAGCVLTLGAAAGCSGPGASGTKTNWFETCDSSVQCGAQGSCICGMCTVPCAEGDECGGGACGSALATAAQCETFLSTDARICLPNAQVAEQTDAAGCTVLPLVVGGTLGDSAPADCPYPGALLCESFDSVLPTVFSTWQEPGGSASLTDCSAFAGPGALHMTSLDGGHSQLRMRLPEPRASGALYARFYLRVTGAAVLPEQSIVFEFWDREDTAEGGQTSILVTSDGRLASFVAAGGHALVASEMDPLARDQWYCIEVSDVIDDAAGSLTVSVDGAAVIESSNLDTLPDNPIGLAVVEAQPQAGSSGTALDVMVDELVVATEPIGCN